MTLIGYWFRRLIGYRLHRVLTGLALGNPSAWARFGHRTLGALLGLWFGTLTDWILGQAGYGSAAGIPLMPWWRHHSLTRGRPNAIIQTVALGVSLPWLIRPA